jgi:hypothetical protein
MQRGSQLGICTPLKPSDAAHLHIAARLLNGGLSPMNWAKNKPGPFIVFILLFF